MLLRRHNGALNKSLSHTIFPLRAGNARLSDTAHVEYLNSFDDCLAAVHAGTVDAYYTYTYQAERLLYDNLRNDLTTALTGGTVVIDHGCGVKSYLYGLETVGVVRGQSVSTGDRWVLPGRATA